MIKWGDVSAGGSVWKGKSLSERSASVPTVSDGGRPYTRLLTLLRLSEKILSRFRLPFIKEENIKKTYHSNFTGFQK